MYVFVSRSVKINLFYNSTTVTPVSVYKSSRNNSVKLLTNEVFN